MKLICGDLGINWRILLKLVLENDTKCILPVSEPQGPKYFSVEGGFRLLEVLEICFLANTDYCGCKLFAKDRFPFCPGSFSDGFHCIMWIVRCISLTQGPLRALIRIQQ